MNEITISQSQAERLLDSINWVLAPYMDENTIQDHPWLVELAECYNQLYYLIPSFENNYEPIIY